MQRPDALTRIGRFIVWCALGLVLLWFLYKIRTVLIILIAGAAVAYALDPLAKRLSGNQPRFRPVGIALAYLAVFAGLGLAGEVGFRPVVDDVRGFVTTLPATVQHLDAWWFKTSVHLRESLPPPVQAQLDQSTTNVGGRVQSLASNVWAYLAGIAGLGQSFVLVLTAASLALVISALLLGDKSYFRKQILWLIPTVSQADADTLLGEIDTVLAAYVRGQIVIAVVVGVIATVAMALLGVKYALILGLFTAVTQLIPMVGGALGLIASVALTALQSPWLALAVLVLYMILYQLSGNVLGPLVMGKAVALHPLIVLLATMVGTVLGGVVGLLLSVPIAGVLKVIWNFFYPRLAPQWGIGPAPAHGVPATPADPASASPPTR